MGIIDDIFSSSNPAKYKAGSYANPGQPAPQQGGGLLDYFDEPGRMQTISSALMGAGQGMLQAPQNGGSFGQAMSGLAGMAGGMAQNKKRVEQEAMFEQLAGGDPLKLAFLKSNPELGMKMMMEQKFAKPTATFSTVQSPYNKGGYGQKNSLTGEIINYQSAPKAAKQGNPIEVLDIASGNNVMIRPDNFDPSKHGPSPKKGTDPLAKVNALLEGINSFPDGDPRRKAYEAMLIKETESKGMKLTVGPNGEVTLTEGSMSPDGGGTTNSMTTELQKQASSASAIIANLNRAKAKFKPEYTGFGARAEQSWLAWKDNLVGVTGAEAEKLKGYTSWRSSVQNNLSTTINALAGAAVSAEEKDRLMSFIPNDEDSPIQFQAKLDDAIMAAKLIRARARYFMRGDNITKGRTPDSMYFEEMRDVIDAEAATKEQDLRAQYPNAKDAEIDKRLSAYIKLVFGI